MAEVDEDARSTLARLVAERRAHLGLSVSAAARAAGVDRGTWTAVEKNLRETEDYVCAQVERVLGWKPGTVRAVLAGDAVAIAEAPPASPELTSENDDISFEIALIEQSDLPHGAKAAMIREAKRLHQRHLAELEAIKDRQVAERREQLRAWMMIARGSS